MHEPEQLRQRRSGPYSYPHDHDSDSPPQNLKIHRHAGESSALDDWNRRRALKMKDSPPPPRTNKSIMNSPANTNNSSSIHDSTGHEYQTPSNISSSESEDGDKNHQPSWDEEDIASLLGSDDKRTGDGKWRSQGKKMGWGLVLFSLIRRLSGRKSTIFSDMSLVLVLFGGTAALHWFLRPISTSSSVVAPSSSFKVANYSFPEENSLNRIAWLMSFPNSGTSYTSYLIRTVTQTNTGSNYGHESGTDPSGLSPSVPIFDDNPIPTWTESWNGLLHQPSKGYILTKTHCGGFSFCPACESFVYNSQLFLKKCLEGDFVMKPAVVSKGYASKDKIARAVHVVRDPFDNVVARFRLERQTLEKKNKAHYPNSREGFRQFCDDLGKIELVEKAQEQAHNFVEDVADLAIPCKADFYRYIQWHNMAFTTTWNLDIPTLVVHYESYATSFNETKDALLEFLEQDEVANAPLFVTGKTYRDYFTADEIDAVSKMTERLALRESWQHTKHYFGQ